jgi:hypothetical protein
MVGVQIRNRCRKGAATTLCSSRFPTRCAQQAMSRTMRTKGSALLPTMIEPATPFSACSALPVDKSATAVVCPASLSSGRSPGGRIREGDDLRRLVQPQACGDACRCNSEPAFRPSGLNAKYAPRVATAAKHDDHLCRVAKKEAVSRPPQDAWHKIISHGTRSSELASQVTS